MKNKNCPYCKSDKTEDIVIRFSNKQEQRVMLCRECKKIFRRDKNEN